MSKSSQPLDIFTFVKRLRDAKIPHRLGSIRDEPSLVEVFMPGEYWEVEFFPSGEIQVERFKSEGTIHDEKVLDELFA